MSSDSDFALAELVGQPPRLLSTPVVVMLTETLPKETAMRVSHPANPLTQDPRKRGVAGPSRRFGLRRG